MLHTNEFLRRARNQCTVDATILLKIKPRVIGALVSRRIRIYMNGERSHSSLGVGLRD